MIRNFFRTMLAALAPCACAGTQALAHGGETAPQQLSVSRVEAQYNGALPCALPVQGSNFGAGLPAVTLGGSPPSFVTDDGTTLNFYNREPGATQHYAHRHPA